MVVETIEEINDEIHSVSTESQVTEDPALKDGSSGRGSTTGASSSVGSSTQESDKFVKKETHHVMMLRVVVLLILFAASATISLVVYFVTSDGEEDNFESQFYAAADKVKEAFMDIARVKMEAAGSLVVAIVAHGQDTEIDGSWPFVTLSSFQQRAYTVKDLSGALYVGINPVVTRENRLAWENYTVNHPDAGWYEEAKAYQKAIGIADLDNRPQVKTDDPRLDLSTGIANHIYDFQRDDTGKGIISPDADWYLPIWQTAPVTDRSMVNQNSVSNSQGARDCMRYQEIFLDGMKYAPPGFGSDDNPATAEIAWLLRLAERKRVGYKGDIFTSVYFPVYDSFDTETREAVGVMKVIIHWARYFKNLLPVNTKGLVFVLENGCDKPYTYQIDGEEVTPLGHGDLHDHKYDDKMEYATFAEIDTIADGTEAGMKLHFDKCPYSIRVYPSQVMEDTFSTHTPAVITTAVAIVFLFAVLMFFAYDRLVERRQRVLMDKAKRTHHIVASLFPKNIRDQILNDDGELRQGGLLGAKNQLRSIASGGMGENQIFGQMPIADMYPDATVLFADISGFTSWSSSREPAQVFVLLQTLYSEFDELAKRRKVFKVETIGDSYVACAGVPEPEPAHAIKVVRFAWDCMIRMGEVTKELETQLGPGTGELTMRFGVNSGPVTAGLLRGDRSRFQLFGDTVNTAARMESTGMPGKIQCSQSTAEILIRSGKEHWVQARGDLVAAKGKGILRTYFITPAIDKAYSANSHPSAEGEDDVLSADFAGELASELLRREREVEWVAELMRDSIREIVALRETRKGKIMKTQDPLPSHRAKNRVPLDEVVDVIKMPNFDSKSADAAVYAVRIPERVSSLVREYVSIIAAAYRENPFHNFDHACHVTMCTSKLLKRIVSPDVSDEDLAKMKDNKKLAQTLHTYTHGINSDPITLFAILFSAIIHDVDHPGVSNKQFAIEHPLLGQRYRSKSVAEQNSLDVAWDVLMDSHFREMREYIFETNEELTRFRQVVVNVVLATDIFDPELNELRKSRWMQAFSESGNIADVNNARATVVIEHIMQASDVSHTMQHWHVYKRFNQKLFEEIMVAYRQGRCGANPAEFWYEGEMKFFDGYVIPLAKKLKECNIFGVSSDECLNNAMRNRMEWEDRGRAIVAEYVQSFMAKPEQWGQQPRKPSLKHQEEKEEL